MSRCSGQGKLDPQLSGKDPGDVPIMRLMRTAAGMQA